MSLFDYTDRTLPDQIADIFADLKEMLERMAALIEFLRAGAELPEDLK